LQCEALSAVDMTFTLVKDMSSFRPAQAYQRSTSGHCSCVIFFLYILSGQNVQKPNFLRPTFPVLHIQCSCYYYYYYYYYSVFFFK